MNKIQGVFDTLNQLKTDYSDLLFNQVIDQLSFLHPQQYLSFKEEFKSAFEGQPSVLYHYLAQQFVQDMNKNPILYFFDWFYKIFVFDENGCDEFFEIAKKKSENTEAERYVNGLYFFYLKDYRKAIFNFNKGTNFMVDYFIGQSYFLLKDYRNSIKYHNVFQISLRDTFSFDEVAMKMLAGFYWHSLGQRSIAHTILSHFDESYRYFEDSNEVLNFNDAYKLSKQFGLDDEIDGFTIYAASYLRTLQEIGDKERLEELVSFLKTLHSV